MEEFCRIWDTVKLQHPDAVVILKDRQQCAVFRDDVEKCLRVNNDNLGLSPDHLGLLDARYIIFHSNKLPVLVNLLWQESFSVLVTETP